MRFDKNLTMSRSSLRIKNYRPMSADFTGKNDKQSIFGSINQDQNQDKKSGVLLINCKSISGFKGAKIGFYAYLLGLQNHFWLQSHFSLNCFKRSIYFLTKEI